MSTHSQPYFPRAAAAQRGAALIFTAFFLLTLVATIGLAVEVGRLYAAQTALQRTATAAAVAGVRALDLCTTVQVSVDDAVDDSIAAQPPSQVAGISSEVALGQQVSANNRLYFNPAGALDADSVRVRLSQPAPATLIGLFSSGGNLTATAAAAINAVAGIEVGNGLVELDGSESVLAGLLGTTEVDLVHYDGLATANVSLADIIDVGAFAGVDELLSTDLALPDSLNLLADAVDSVVGTVNDTAAATLRDLAALADPNRSSSVGQILSIEPAVEDVIAQLPLNTLGLLSALAQAATQGTPVQIPVGVNIPGVATVAGTVRVIQPPQHAFGRPGRNASGEYRTEAHTSQVVVQLNLEVLGALPAILGGALIHLPIYLKVANATAGLEDIVCAGSGGGPVAGGTYQHVAYVAPEAGIAEVGIGEFEDINSADPQPSSDPVDLINVLGIASVSTTEQVQVQVSPPLNPQEMEFVGPYPSGPQSTDASLGGSLSGALSRLASDLATPGTVELEILGLDLLGVLSGLLSGLVSLVIGTLSPVISTLDAALLGPVLNLLGVSFANADITVTDVVVDQARVYCTTFPCLPPS